MLHKLRAGLVNPDRTKLYGTVEIDEAFVSAGRVRKTRRGRGTGKPMVVVAVESHGKTAGRVRLRQIESASEANLSKFILDHVEEGSTIITDGWGGYKNIGRYGYSMRVAEGDVLHHVHRTISNLKAWLIGTHHGVSAKHLQAYLNEFTFRRNRHITPMAAFESALGIGVHVNSPKYEELYSVGEDGGWVHPNPDNK
jgi:transposase-like protein